MSKSAKLILFNPPNPKNPGSDIFCNYHFTLITSQINLCILKSQFKVGDRALVAPAVTNASNWQTGTILEVDNNSFNGIVISIKTDAWVIYFHQEKYFKKEQ